MELINNLDKTIKFNGNTVRIVGTYDKPLFVVADICKVLGLTNTTHTIKTLPDKWKEFITIDSTFVELNSNNTGKVQEMACVTEPGLYRIIMRSNKEVAQTFQEVVCEEILPAIRKTGEFKMKKYLEDKEKELKIKDKRINDLHKLVKRKERQKFKKKHSVYIISNPVIKDYYKIGKTGDLNKRLDGLGSGAPEKYEVKHHRNVSNTFEETAIESIMLSIFDVCRIQNDYKGCRKREWLKGVSLNRLKKELNIIVNFLMRRKNNFKLENQTPDLLFLDENGNDINNRIKEDLRPNIKECYTCGKIKTLDEFYDKIENEDEKEGSCKDCFNRYKKVLKTEKDEREIIKRPDGIKKCRTCNELKDFSNFSLHGTSKDGYEYSCIDCKNKSVNEIKKEKKMCLNCRRSKEINEYNKFRLGYHKFCKICQKDPVTEEEENNKKCSSCTVIFPLDNFRYSKTSSDGYQNYCIECSKKKNKENKEKIKASNSVIKENKQTKKSCTKCNSEKNINDFYKCISEKDGYKTICKDCIKQSERDLRKSKTT
jgi:prophage antirepressor-like protein